MTQKDLNRMMGKPHAALDDIVKDYVDSRFYTFELNETTYDFNTRTLTAAASAALLAAIQAKKPIFYVGYCAGETNMFDTADNEPFCGFVNYNPEADINGRYFINIPDYFTGYEQRYGATFDPAAGEFYPNGV